MIDFSTILPSALAPLWSCPVKAWAGCAQVGRQVGCPIFSFGSFYSPTTATDDRFLLFIVLRVYYTHLHLCHLADAF